MNATIRVLLADDDIIVREGLAGLLDRQNGIDVVAVAENGSEALRECSRQVVDVALLDVDMPVLDGLAAAKEMARLYPSVAVVMLTVFEHEESLAKSLALNVRGFLTKDIPSAQLAQLIKQAYAGYTVFGPRPTSILADSYLNSGKTGTNSARRRALHKNVGIKPFPAYISSIRHFETREFLTKNRLIRHNWSGNSSGKAPPPQPGDVSWSGSSARSSSSQARPIRSG